MFQNPIQNPSFKKFHHSLTPKKFLKQEAIIQLIGAIFLVSILMDWNHPVAAGARFFKTGRYVMAS